MNNFLMFSIYISLFLFLLGGSGIFFFQQFKLRELVMLHILLSNILLKKLVYIKLEPLLISILLLEIHHAIHIFMLLLLMVDLILIIIGKHQNLFRGLVFRKTLQKCSLDILSIHEKKQKILI